MPDLTYDVSGGVGTITLNRPASLNSLTVATKLALRDALEQAAADEAVRTLVLTGAGRAFCVGQDLKEHLDGLESGDVELSTVIEHYNPIIELLTTLPKPVVAAVNGPAAGAGASLAFACDFRIAAESANFLMAFARVGLGPDSGASWTLQRLIGYGRASAMLMLAEPVSASAAMEMGLVNAVVPDADVVATASELAGKLAAGPTMAYAAIKSTLRFSAGHGLTESLAEEAERQSRCGQSVDHREAVHAFLEKRPAVFTGK